MGALHDEVRNFCFAGPSPTAQRMDFEQLVIEQRVAHGASANGGRLVVRQLFVGREVPLAVGNARLRRFGEKEPPSEIAEGAIHCRERPGGLLKHYYRQAA